LEVNVTFMLVARSDCYSRITKTLSLDKNYYDTKKIIHYLQKIITESVSFFAMYIRSKID